MVMMSHGGDKLYDGPREFDLTATEHTPFMLDLGLPVWRHLLRDGVIEKTIFMPYRRNSVIAFYKSVGPERPLQLSFRPQFRFRQHEANFEGGDKLAFQCIAEGDHFTIAAGDLPPLTLRFSGDVSFTPDADFTQTFFAHDAARGNDPNAWWWCPGTFTCSLPPSGTIALMASTEDGEDFLSVDPFAALTEEKGRRERLIEQGEQGLPSGLVLAADQFLITPQGRDAHRQPAAARGDELRAVVAGYHWFTDWGRDTMIALEGLTAPTRRLDEARWILRSFADYVRDGLVPNFFPDGKDDGVYHTADATLWYFHALSRYLGHTDDRQTLELVLPKLAEIADHHLAGTKFGIGVDPADHLLVQGQEGFQLTWMDAKVDDWVVTPRRGKAVEINALWYNAMCLLADWMEISGDEVAAARWRKESSMMKESFNRRFWNEQKQCLFDVVDGEAGNDDAIRPNQIFALSLDHPVLDAKFAQPVMTVVTDELLTPFGLRTLSPAHADYQRQYFGNLRARDAAYHQGTVWPWLLGHFIDAWLHTYPDRIDEAAEFLPPLLDHAANHAAGSVHEIFDAAEPFTPRGCIAQAWSVAELLRAKSRLDRLAARA